MTRRYEVIDRRAMLSPGHQHPFAVVDTATDEVHGTAETRALAQLLADELDHLMGENAAAPWVCPRCRTHNESSSCSRCYIARTCPADQVMNMPMPFNPEGNQ